MSAPSETATLDGALLALPEELTIYHVSGLREAWQAWLDGQHAPVQIDGRGVAQVDAAGVQLLAALLRALDARAIPWQLLGGDGTLRQALQTVGLDGWLAAAAVRA